jgi:hypothetical protein
LWRISRLWEEAPESKYKKSMGQSTLTMLPENEFILTHGATAGAIGANLVRPLCVSSPVNLISGEPLSFSFGLSLYPSISF